MRSSALLSLLSAAAATAQAQQALLLAPCNSTSSAQAFSINGGGIGVIAPRPNSLDVCLCAPPSGGAGALSLQTCEGGPPLHALETGFTFTGAALAPIPWLPDARAPASGLCVTAAAAGSAPQLAACAPAGQPPPAAQLWRYTAAGQLQGTAAGGAAVCLEAAPAPPPPPPLLSSVFGSGMVLQRGEEAALWGAAAPGAVVTVTLSGRPPLQSAPAGADGRWAVALPAAPAGTGFNLTVDDGSGHSVTLTDVAFGDVICKLQAPLPLVRPPPSLPLPHALSPPHCTCAP